jgi:hypothetical protein
MTIKERQRAELEQLVAAYDGEITRNARAGHVSVGCTVCNARRRVAAEQLNFKLHCLRCGAAMTVAR